MLETKKTCSDLYKQTRSGSTCAASEVGQSRLHALQHRGGHWGLYEEDQVLRVLLSASGRGPGQVRKHNDGMTLIRLNDLIDIAGGWLTLLLQGSVLHKDHRRGQSLPGEPRPWPHPEPNRLLPDEHPHHAALHLPVSPRRERPQHQGTDWRRLRLIPQRKWGLCVFVCAESVSNPLPSVSFYVV